MEEVLFDQLLDDNDRYKLYMYQIIQLYSEQGVTFSILEQQLELSKFKVKQLVYELVDELKEETLSSQIGLLEVVDDVISGQLNNQGYQLLRLRYFNQSAAGDLLLKNFFHGYTISEFAALKYISLAKAYKVRKKVNQFLVQWELVLSKTDMVGNEKRIRGFFFQLINYFYNGESAVFEKKVQFKINQTVNRLQFISRRTLSTNQKSQLAIFLGVQYYRVLNGFKLDTFDLVQYSGVSFEKLLDQFFKITLYKKETIANEQIYLVLFLLTIGQIDKNHLVYHDALVLPIKFTAYLSKEYPAVQSLLMNDVFRDRLTVMALKLEVLEISTNTFISERQFIYFKQNFPLIHQIIQRFVKK